MDIPLSIFVVLEYIIFSTSFFFTERVGVNRKKWFSLQTLQKFLHLSFPAKFLKNYLPTITDGLQTLASLLAIYEHIYYRKKVGDVLSQKK